MNNVTSTLLATVVSPRCLPLYGMQQSSAHQGAHTALYAELKSLNTAMNTVNFVIRPDLRAVGSL